MLSVADGVWDKALGHRAYGRYFGGLVLRLIGGLRRAEDVVELLLDSLDQPVGGRRLGGFQIRPLRQAQGRLCGLALVGAGVVRRVVVGFL